MFSEEGDCWHWQQTISMRWLSNTWLLLNLWFGALKGQVPLNPNAVLHRKKEVVTHVVGGVRGGTRRGGGLGTCALGTPFLLM